MAIDAFPGLQAMMELPAPLRSRVPLIFRLYALFSERAEIPIGELQALLGASKMGIKDAIYKLIELGLLRREWGGNPKAPIRYLIVAPPADTSLTLGETA